jgi:hypothetical protein
VKRIFYLSFVSIAIAALALLAASLIPHHHHKGMVCTVVEICEQDHAINDKHTQHDASNEHDDQSCIAENHSIFSPTDEDTKCKIPSCNTHNPAPIFLTLYLCADYSLYNTELPDNSSGYGEYLLFYTSTDASQAHALRAPPSLIG